MSTIVDMRLRPPLPSWLKTPLFTPGGSSMTAHPDFPKAASVEQGSPELLLAEMDAAGVGLGVAMGRQSPGGLGSVPNEEVADWVDAHASHFVAWVGIDVTRPMDQILAEIATFVEQRGFKGVSIEPSIAPGFQGADDKRLYPLYDDCQRRRLPISITLSSILQASEKRPLEFGSPNQLYRIALDFPTLAIHVAHAAWPWTMDMVSIAFTCRNVWLSPDQYMVPNMPGADVYAKAALEYFPDRVLFGTAYPFKPLRQMVDAYRAWNLPKAIEEKVLGGNALRLMHMD